MSTSIRQFVIDPDSKLDYGHTFADWLTPLGTTLSTSTWAITPTGPTLSEDTNDTTTTVVWVTGCTVGVTYTLTNSVVDSAGREDDRSIVLVCRER